MHHIARLSAGLLALSAAPAFAASGPFFSLHNTNFVVLLGFLVFIGILFYFNVPSMLGGMLDKRADDIKSELDEARAIHEEAKAVYASFERKTLEVKEQADRIVAHAKEEAETAAAAAKEDLKLSIARRLAAAEEQIISAEQSAVKEVRDSAISVAVAAAGDAIAASMKAGDQNKLVDDSIASLGSKLH